MLEEAGPLSWLLCQNKFFAKDNIQSADRNSVKLTTEKMWLRDKAPKRDKMGPSGKLKTHNFMWQHLYFIRDQCDHVRAKKRVGSWKSGR